MRGPPSAVRRNIRFREEFSGSVSDQLVNHRPLGATAAESLPPVSFAPSWPPLSTAPGTHDDSDLFGVHA